ncbi:MAG: hypothetical protein KBT06_11350 [Prevotellaceae bacterium]|nr:hypothetical protein [Candidatus Colivivens equi]
MKKLVYFFAIISSVILIACNGNQTPVESEENKEADSLQNILSQKEDEINDLMNSFAEIQEGFNCITEAEGRINDISDSKGEAPEIARNIQENMDYIAEVMQQNRERIAQLEAKLNAGTIQSTKLKEQIEKLAAQYEEKVKEIEELKQQLAAKDIEIKALSDTIVSLASENKSVKADLDASEQVVNTQDAQLNTAYFVFGTKKELKAHGILDGKDVMKGNYDKSYFTKVDIRNFKSLPLDSKSVELLTSHPGTSYSLVKDNKGYYTLKIIDATKFWSVSKYLVIKVK